MSPVKRALYIGLSLLILAAIPLGGTIFYTVDEREMAVVIQFGQPVSAKTEPGLYMKLPLIQEVRRLPKTFQYIGEGSKNLSNNATSVNTMKLSDITTADGKKIEATIWAVWRITDPIQFIRTLRTVENAESRVKQFVRSNTRVVLTSNDLAEIVRSTDREMRLSIGLPESALENTESEQVNLSMGSEAIQSIEKGRKSLTQQIRQNAEQALRTSAESSSSNGGGDSGSRGIELVDIGLARIEFVEQVRNAAFERLISLMDAIATKNRSEGEQRKQEIINQAKADAERIRGEGSQQANIIRGEVEAEIITAFSQAIEESGGFYDFNRTLELYEKALANGDTQIILGSDTPLLRLLTEFDSLPNPPVLQSSSSTITTGRDNANATPASNTDSVDVTDDTQTTLELPDDPFSETDEASH